jgi:hypothetical protein
MIATVPALQDRMSCAGSRSGRLPREGLLLGGEEDAVSPRDIFEVEDLTLVIDEVSMVRSDVLNAIDHGLRQQRERGRSMGVAVHDQQEAADVNRRCLAPLAGNACVYHAGTSGEFEALARRRRSDGGGLPAETELVLKVGARVVFIRNDRHRRWVNGTKGVVTRLGDDEIDVTNDAGEELTVGLDTWTTYRRVKVDKEVRREEAGSMSQLPLRLGWAITTHKSPGDDARKRGLQCAALSFCARPSLCRPVARSQP